MNRDSVLREIDDIGTKQGNKNFFNVLFIIFVISLFAGAFFIYSIAVTDGPISILTENVRARGNFENK